LGIGGQEPQQRIRQKGKADPRLFDLLRAVEGVQPVVASPQGNDLPACHCLKNDAGVVGQGLQQAQIQHHPHPMFLQHLAELPQIPQPLRRHRQLSQVRKNLAGLAPQPQNLQANLAGGFWQRSRFQVNVVELGNGTAHCRLSRGGNGAEQTLGEADISQQQRPGGLRPVYTRRDADRANAIGQQQQNLGICQPSPCPDQLHSGLKKLLATVGSLLPPAVAKNAAVVVEPQRQRPTG
jgi:hypothetical protein